MNRLFFKAIDTSNLIFATLIIFLGLTALLIGLPIVSVFSLALTSYIAFVIVFGKKEATFLFTKPINPIKNIFKYYLLNWFVSLCIALILEYLLSWKLSSNPVNNGVTPWLLLLIPIMLLGEELFSIYFLAIFSSKFRLPLASILSAIIFGIIHFSTYNNGNIFQTLVHVLLIQGSARIIFNQAAIKSNSIWTSWIIHVLFDFSSVLLPILTHYFL